MLDDQSQTEVAKASRSTAIIVLALCAGIIVFGAFVIFFHQAPKQPLGVTTYLSLGFAAMEIVLMLTVPRVMVATQRKQIAAGTWQSNQQATVQTDAGRLALVYLQTTIVSCALLEGAAFFALVAHMLEGQIITLIVAAVLLIGVALQMPLGDRVQAWIEHQLKIMEDEKLVGNDSRN